ncbi:ammonium transporter [Lacticaseibacillus thailandensis DSM 22698 = JCM 13996]|uniref:Ammonium transporter n=1 Tax=Lacticaseibacillus thailandensis DSM 22698 = JCM 13996 TaxID=1423810 RepID=A0A0R2C8V8_9LACO|nr:ammonium transporter [Lacticaseibacillus thailandensis DSM 22698 = JCM 13996]
MWFMTPGLAFFYGGMVSKGNVVNTMLSVFYITGIAILLWVGGGYELAFNGNVLGIIGRIHGLFLSGVHLTHVMGTGLPVGAYVLFQMMFAIITPALFVGAVVGRMHFKYLTWFIVCWSVLVYYPLVHMVWGPGGLLGGLGMLDFAGGTVIHINAGVTALVLSVFLGRRRVSRFQPYNRPWVLLGTAILWIGWYGFNAGSALGVNRAAVTAALTTSVAAASALVAWMVLDVYRTGKPTLVGVCTGALCGLVGITPAAGYVTCAGAAVIGLVATIASYSFIQLVKPHLGVDDTLDAFGCHGVSGIVGSLLTGVFASKDVAPQIKHAGVLYGGGMRLLLVQLLGTLVTVIIVAGMVALITVTLRRCLPMRVGAQEERLGLDLGEHGETADYTVAALRASTPDVLNYPDEFTGQLGGLGHLPNKRR